ncbi:MAG: hypothetical protein ACM3MI_15245 [Clostridiales bacterium]
MGQQQLLLIVLAIIVVGIAVLIGITLFHANSVDTKRNQIINESVNLAALAQQYYMKPSSLAGGNKSFTGWTIPTSLATTANGTYSAAVNTDNVVISAIGNEVVTASTPVEVKITVYAKTYQVEIVH